MRARLGWIAVAVLIALAFLSGPSMLDTRVQPAFTAAVSVEEREQRVGGDVGSIRWSADHDTPNRHWVPGLPPSSQNHLTTSARAAVAEPISGPAPTVIHAGQIPRQPTACSPETLQIFRC